MNHLQQQQLIQDGRIQELQRQVNLLQQEAKAGRLMPTPSARVSRTAAGTFIDFQPGRASATLPPLQQYRVSGVGPDYLECKTYGISEAGVETVGTDTIFVAKPFTLRQTPWHSKTIDNRRYSYEGSGGVWRYVTLLGAPTSSETPRFSEYFPTTTAGQIRSNEKVWPEYIPGQSIIYTLSLQEPVIFPTIAPFGVVPISIIDVNLDARSWVPIWRAITVCVDNGDGTSNNKRVLIRASENFT
jgi:hypothetical protein